MLNIDLIRPHIVDRLNLQHIIRDALSGAGYGPTRRCVSNDAVLTHGGQILAQPLAPLASSRVHIVTSNGTARGRRRRWRRLEHDVREALLDALGQGLDVAAPHGLAPAAELDAAEPVQLLRPVGGPVVASVAVWLAGPG
ncbi:hypothetical protein PspLS_01882 [Pyricularia sp. CBS 133598]|nr:hypothetical protein PspLS_01882 [Pyricularia sp. CBS 133598]